MTSGNFLSVVVAGLDPATPAQHRRMAGSASGHDRAG